MQRTFFLSELALFAGILMLMIGHGLHGTVLALRAELDGFPVMTTGIIVAVYHLGFLGGAIWGPRLVQRVGHIRTFAAFASLSSAAFLGYALLPDPLFWVFLRLVIGFCMAILYLVAESWLNDKAPANMHGRIFAMYMVTQFTGLALGQLFVNLGDPKSFELFISLSVFVSLSLIPLALTTRPGPSLEKATPLHLKKLYEAAPLAVITCFGIALVNGAFFGLLPVFGIKVGLSIPQIALLMMGTTLAGLLFQWPAGWLSDNIDRRFITFYLGLGATAISAVFALGTLNDLTFIVIGSVLGGLLLLFYPVSVAIAIDSIEHDQIVDASATMLGIFSVGAFIGPVVSTVLMKLFGPWGLPIWQIGILGIMTGFALLRVYTRPPMNPDEQSDYVAVVPTTPMAMELYDYDDVEITKEFVDDKNNLKNP